MCFVIEIREFRYLINIKKNQFSLLKLQKTTFIKILIKILKICNNHKKNENIVKIDGMDTSNISLKRMKDSFSK